MAKSQTFFAESIFTAQDSLRGAINPARNYNAYFYDLNLQFYIDEQRIKGSNTIYFIATEDLDSLQIDLFGNFRVNELKFKSPIKFKRRGDHIFIYFNEKIQKGSYNIIEIYFEGSPVQAQNAPWDGGFIWQKDSLARPYVAVACEGLGASSWWPCRDHLGQEPDSMRLRFTVPSDLKCISNGQFISETILNNNLTQFEWKINYPINTYNVTFYIGNYEKSVENYTSVNGKNLQLNYYALDYNIEKASKFFHEEVLLMLPCMEKYFGPYPFQKDGFKLVETNYWGMEHQSAIAYGNNFKRNIFGFDFIIIHESGHEWWGNAISTTDHGQMWLHEAFTTYSEALYLECLHGKDSAISYLLNQKRSIACKHPIQAPLQVNYTNFPDADMYYKGSWMLHTIRNIIDNDSLWFSILKNFVNDYGVKNNFKPIYADTFISYLNIKTNSNYNAIFNQYLNFIEIPTLEYKIKQKGKNIELEYRWIAEEEDFTMPVLITVHGKDYKLIADKSWQTERIKKAKTNNIKFREDLMLFIVKNTN